MLGMVSSISVSVTQDSMSFVMIPIGDVIDNEYTMVSKLGMGGFGEIYCCLSSKMDKVAIKVERESKPGGLAEEERILRLLEGCKYTSRLTKSGKHNGHLAYLVMPLLGENLGNLRRQQPTNTFSLLTTLMLGRQMLRCLREVHDHGILHRDIKPGNFVLGTVEEGNPRTVIMIDYGLSRNHLDSNGVPHPEKKESRWVGSRKYMSLNTHNRKDQARRDDLWSLLYVLIEFRLGSLPWGELRGTESFEKIRNLKRVYDDQKLVCGLPQEFLYYMCYLKTLSYSDRPDYDYLDSLFASLFVRAGGNPGTPFDWETRESAAYNNRVEEERGNASDLVYPSLEEAIAFSELPPRGSIEELSARPIRTNSKEISESTHQSRANRREKLIEREKAKAKAKVQVAEALTQEECVLF
eukprot:TRINITY_DN1748_c0_g1_i3.p1 TRINITY_DN1748_c0_g1~~TRINITY_DN1748_c0_g1_i3.p1  ORF type:complete len:410 (+),score=60.41 TRINITY_DN1748_c0_g1_i3:53-1282(+)